MKTSSVFCSFRSPLTLAYWPDPDCTDTSMIRSMTAYANAESTTAQGWLACEVRAVNHRFL
jgi:hypothetical protein